MMALIGFAFVLILGLVLLASGIAAVIVSIGLTGSVEWAPVLIYLGLGGLLVWYALKHSPMHITLGI